MKESYYNREDLKKFGEITDFQKELGDKFFEYYDKVFKEGALTKREKSLIALAVAHAIQCPYCIDAYTSDTLKQGCDEEELMELLNTDINTAEYSEEGKATIQEAKRAAQEYFSSKKQK